MKASKKQSSDHWIAVGHAEFAKGKPQHIAINVQRLIQL